MKIEKYMKCLAIEMTRRCNMNCKFCGKGKAQNIDINKEIIDKTLDEMEGVYINELRISGGEPLLAHSIICYLIEKIIEKHIYINEIIIFTNGIADTNLELANSIQNLLKYLRDIEPEVRSLIRWSNDVFKKKYPGTSSSKFRIIISDIERDIDYSKNSKISNTINFYKHHIFDEDFVIIKQSDCYSNLGVITLEGNAKSNYKDLIGSIVQLNNIRILNNNYFFMCKSANLDNEPCLYDVTFIKKSLSVSANGNVFPGCIMSYDNVDKKPMFNIMDCNKDFYKRVNTFCWEHPINERALNIRNKMSAIKFCEKRNIIIKDLTIYDYEKIKFLNELVIQYEKLARDMHSILPKLYFDEIDLLSSITLVLRLFEKDVPIEFIRLYLENCIDLDENIINSISEKFCRGLIASLIDKNNER